MAGFQGPPLYRPFKPGERRPNADGSYSTEITTTWQLPDGQWANIPSLWVGPNGPTQFEENDETNILRAARDYETSAGPTFRRYGSLDQAEAAARARSNAGGAGAGGQMADLARIKKNVAKMAAQGAPEEDIDGYIASEGVTIDDVRNFRAAPVAPESQQSVDLRGELSAMTQNPAKGQYDALPGWQKPIVAASDIVQLTADGATFGFGDKAVAAVRSPFTGKSYEDELAGQRQLTRGARNRAGWAGTTAEVLGSVALPLRAGATLSGRFGTAGMSGAKGLGARTALMAAEGAGYGGLSAAGHDQDVATGAGIGAIAGAGGNLVGEGISAGVNKVAGLFNKKVPVPSVDDLKSAGSTAFKRAEAEGVMFNNAGVNRLRTNIIDDMTKRGFDPANEPGVMPVIKRLEAMGSDNVTFEGLKTLREVASNGWRAGMPSNNAAIGQIIKRIDELVDAAALDRSILVMGRDPKAAAAAVKEARKHWHTAKKLETVERLQSRGQIIGESQKNADVAGATKRQLRTILTNEGKQRGFNQAELEALRKASGWTPGQRLLDAASGMMPTGRLSGLAQGSLGAANLATGNLPGLALQGASMVAGWGANKASEALAKKSVLELTRLIANGGVPPAQVQNLMQRLAHSKREALSRALMAIGVTAGSQAVAQ